jgi:hypothetical protein
MAGEELSGYHNCTCANARGGVHVAQAAVASEQLQRGVTECDRERSSSCVDSSYVLGVPQLVSQVEGAPSESRVVVQVQDALTHNDACRCWWLPVNAAHRGSGMTSLKGYTLHDKNVVQQQHHAMHEIVLKVQGPSVAMHVRRRAAPFDGMYMVAVQPHNGVHVVQCSPT